MTLSGLVVLGMSLATAVAASAHVEGAGCSGSATDTKGKAIPPQVDLGKTDVWTVSKDSYITGEGTAPGEESGSAYAIVFGFPIPVSLGGGPKGSFGQASLDVSQFSQYARVIAVAGQSTTCSGYLTLVVGDVQALDTWLGKGALAMIGLGIIGLVALALRVAK